MILFIILIVKCFQAIGDTAHNETSFSRQERFMIWAIGCALVGHVASFFSVAYFDQIIIFWYLAVAICATLLELNVSAETILVVRETDTLMEIESANA